MSHGIFDTLEGVNVVDKTDGSMRRAAQVRKDLDAHIREQHRLFERISESQHECLQQGLAVEFPLDAPLAAAYSVWQHEQQNNTDDRVRDARQHVAAFKAIAEVGEAPIPPIPDDA